MADLPLLPPEAAEPTPAPAPAAPAPPRKRISLRVLFPVAGLAVLAAAASLLVFQPDELAALTALPAWVWPIPALLLVGIGCRAAPRLLTAAALLACVVYVLWFCEEPGDSLRRRESPSQEWLSARADGRGLRVVTVNASGRIEAVDEAFAQEPDLVFVQESPPEQALRDLALRRFGPGDHLAFGADTSILARGAVDAADDLSAGSPFREAVVRFKAGPVVRAFSVRLLTPPTRLDLWRPSAWRESRDHRRAQRKQLAGLAKRLAGVSASEAVLVGGDWNAPAGDLIFRELPSSVRDLWVEGGSGFGNTILTDIPFHRIDRIFGGAGVSASSVRTRRLAGTDHRSVTAEVIVGSPEAAR